MALNDEKSADRLHQHYKDSFGYIREREKRRDKLFMFVLLLLAALLSEVQYPTAVPKVLTEVSAGGTKVDLAALPVRALLSFTWVMLFAFCLRHIQVSVSIERQYQYLHVLESRLDALADGGAISREGGSYLQGIPLFTDWAWVLYTMLFPALLLGVAVYAFVCEVEGDASMNTAFDAAVFGLLTLSVVIYRVDALIRFVLRRIKKKRGKGETISEES